MKDTKFNQANKKDANAVTGGKHTMSTTKKGRLLQSRQKPYSAKNTYHIGDELGRLTVEYHTAHTLQVIHYPQLFDCSMEVTEQK